MSNTKPKRPRDANKLAYAIVQKAISDQLVDEQLSEQQRSARKKGGKNRAANLSPEKRSEIARLAAKARWDKKK